MFGALSFKVFLCVCLALRLTCVYAYLTTRSWWRSWMSTLLCWGRWRTSLQSWSNLTEQRKRGPAMFCQGRTTFSRTGTCSVSVYKSRVYRHFMFSECASVVYLSVLMYTHMCVLVSIAHVYVHVCTLSLCVCPFHFNVWVRVHTCTYMSFPTTTCSCRVP